MANSKNLYDAVVFDMDGVIIDSKEHVETFWIEKMEEYGIDIPEDDELEMRFHGRPARPTVNDLFAELPEETREEIMEEVAQYDASAETFSMIPGVERFLKQCANAGIRLGLVTSALPGKVDRMLEGLNYPSPFEAMVTANLVENGKPDPECYLLIADKLNVDPQKMIVFEDSISGVKAAVGAGATVIGVNEDYLATHLKNAGAVEVIPDFMDADLEAGSENIRVCPFGKKKEKKFPVVSV